MSQIPYGRQHITEDDIDAVVSVLRSDYLTQGPKIAEFEAALLPVILKCAKQALEERPAPE